ncbi:hypothetical protein [Vibrio hyugaensis]|uniref:hypothetical protein n=1 Tax=Vibrio hyugaensis TaxID=1534743 RepID=UPI0005EFA5F0|nr:hypothetical protein [Vibrio hyugaensis]
MSIEYTLLFSFSSFGAESEFYDFFIDTHVGYQSGVDADATKVMVDTQLIKNGVDHSRIIGFALGADDNSKSSPDARSVELVVFEVAS